MLSDWSIPGELRASDVITDIFSYRMNFIHTYVVYYNLSQKSFLFGTVSCVGLWAE